MGGNKKKSKSVLDHRVGSNEVECYGHIWDRERFNELAVELWCYLVKLKPEDGGLGEEQHFRNAFNIMWPNYKWTDWMEMMVSAWCTEEVTIILGHTRASKTFGTAPILYLDYKADPYNTMTSLSTVTFSGLRARMWGDLMRAVNSATEPCPFIVKNNSNEMRIYTLDNMGKPDLKSMIEGFAISKTKDSQEKIQGMHADRRRWILDEAEGVAQAIFDAEANPMSSPNYKSFKLANPLDRHSAFGLLYEPEGGWSAVDDSDLSWRSKKGHLVLHFDGLQSHNMKIFNSLPKAEYEEKKLPFMLLPEYEQKIYKQHGPDSIQYWKFVRGFPPPDGTVAHAFPSSVIARMKQNITFDFQPFFFLTLDPAFDHDNCVAQLGMCGQNREDQVAIQWLKTFAIQTKIGKNYDPKDYQIAHECIDICKENGVVGKNFIMDKTGNGRGVFAIIYKEWSKNVHGVEFGGVSTDRPIKADDPEKASDRFVKFVDELWFRHAAWATEGLIGGIENLSDETEFDLGGRLYLLTSEKPERQTMETKKEYKSRLGRSPDYGDSAVLSTELLAIKGIHIGGTLSTDDVKTDNHSVSRRNRSNRLSKIHNAENAFPSDPN